MNLQQTALGRTLSGGHLGTLLTNGTMLLNGLVTSILAARSLGPAGRGEYAAWQAWAATIAVIALMGLPQVLVLDNWTPGRHTLADLGPQLACVFAPAAVLLSVLWLLRGSSVETLAAALLFAVATQLGAVTASEAQRSGNMGREFSGARLTPLAAASLAMIGLVLAGSASPTRWLLVVAAAQSAATFAWLLVVARPWQAYRTDGRRTLRESLLVAPGNWVSQLHYRFDVLAVATLFPSHTVGYYATGVAAQGAVLAAGQVSGMTWFSGITNDVGSRDKRLRRELLTSVGLSAAVAVPVATTSEAWVPTVYGNDFAPAVPLVVGMCVVGVAQSIDYLLAHECLLTGNRLKVSLCRMPSIVILVGGFALVHLGRWPLYAIPAIPALGYISSSLLFWWASRSTARRTREESGVHEQRDGCDRPLRRSRTDSRSRHQRVRVRGVDNRSSERWLAAPQPASAGRRVDRARP